MGSVILDEQTAPSSPPSGSQELYFDSVDHHLKAKNSSGSVTDFNPSPSGITALTGDVSATGPGSAAATVNSAGGATAVELGYSSGVTSAIQTQLNGKQASGSYITALTGDVTAAGPGSSAATVASVGGSTAAHVHSAELDVNAGPSKVFYIDKNRPGSYTPDGSVYRPWLTLNDAKNQVIANNDGANYTWLVAPGTYTENLDLSNAAFTRLAIISMSQCNGSLSNDAIPVTSIVGNITSTSNNANLKALIVKGFDLQGTINLTGDTNGTTFGQYGLMFANMIIYSTGAPAITANNVSQVIFDDVGTSIQSGGGGISITNVNSFLVYHSFLALGTTTIVTNNAINKPSGFGGTTVQYSFGNNTGAVTVDAGSTFTQRYDRQSGAVTNSGTMSSISSTYSATVTQNSGASWTSNGDNMSALPNVSAITFGGIAYRFDKGHFLNGYQSATNVNLGLKDGHIGSTITTAPTATPNANAGTGATCTVTHATDVAGTINLTTTATSPAAGAQAAITFNKAYNVAPICILTPANANAATLAVSSGVYVTTSTTAITINFANTDAVGNAYVWNYQVIETQ